MRLLRLHRFKQEPSECAIAACATVANHYNPKIDYEFAKKVTIKQVCRNTSEGLYSGQIGSLLNCLGFQKVRIVTSDLNIVDYSWAKLSTAKKVEAIQAMLRSRSPSVDERDQLKHLLRFLTEEGCSNELVVDHLFKSHIEQALTEGKPVILSYNWNMLWGIPKQDAHDTNDFVRGTFAMHAVCCRGFDSKAVDIVDSHHEFYKRKLKRLRNGYYTIPWDELLTVMGSGDVIIPESYDEKAVYELVSENNKSVYLDD